MLICHRPLRGERLQGRTLFTLPETAERPVTQLPDSLACHTELATHLEQRLGRGVREHAEFVCGQRVVVQANVQGRDMGSVVAVNVSTGICVKNSLEILKYNFKGELTVVISNKFNVKKKSLNQLSESVKNEIKLMLKKYSSRDVSDFISKKEKISKISNF